MQNDTEIEQLQERFNELSETLADQFEALFAAEAKLKRRVSQMHFRHVEKRRYGMLSLKEPIYPVFVEIISALKSIEELLSECEGFNETVCAVSDDLYFVLDDMCEKLQECIEKYVSQYRNGSAEFKKELSEVFAGQTDLIGWFMSYVAFHESAEYGFDESETEPDNTRGINAFFENTSVLLFSPSEDPKKLFQDADKKYKLLLQEFDKPSGWFDMVSKFNDDLEKNSDNYLDKIKMIEEHCENFLQMRMFITELFKVLKAFEKYLDTLPAGEMKDTLESSMRVLINLIDKLEGNVIALYGFMKKLAAECKENNNQNLSEFMREFIEPWQSSKFSDVEALVQSVRVIWEADIEEQLSSPELERNSFGK